MTNAYVTVDLFKNADVANLPGSSMDDTRLRILIEAVSRWIDRYCGRHFYAINQTLKFDGDGSTKLLLRRDLISIDASGLKTDDNKDRTFETTWATTDYLLLPSNADPTTLENPQSRPYTRIVVDLDAGTEDLFPQGFQTVQIAGQWGFWRHLRTATETINEEVDTSETEIDINTRTDIQVGHTILVDSEQMYVTDSIGGTKLVVRRAVNGTTAASHSTGASIQYYEYPEAIREACIAQTALQWKAAQAGYTAEMSLPEIGVSQRRRAVSPDAVIFLSAYRKWAVGPAA